MRTCLVPIALACVALPRLSAEDPPSLVTFVWSEGIETPGVCVEKASWFVSVAPTVLGGQLEIEGVRAGGEVFKARVLHLDPEERLCLVETDQASENTTPVPLAAKSAPQPGEKAHCLSDGSHCRSVVAGKDWSYRGVRFPSPLLRLRVTKEATQCRIGTALVGESGELAALVTGEPLASGSEYYAIPAARIRKMVADVKQHRRSGSVWVGLIFDNETSVPEVIEVRDGSPAEEAGFAAGDLVLGINGASIDCLDDLDEAIQNLPAGEEASVRILRGLDVEQRELVPRFVDSATTSR